jgi:hypothetical protein
VANRTYPVLCGGTYFTLILEARRQRTSQRSRYEGEQDGLSQPDTLTGLGKVVYTEYIPPSNKQTFKTNVNAYKTCADDGSNLSFLFQDKVSAFDSKVKSAYNTVLDAMCGFVNTFLEVGTSINKEEWLIKAILDLIENDESIPDEQEFFIGNNGQGIKKSTLRQMNDFSLQPFLLGVWHYIVVNRPDNRSGKGTFDRWCPSRGRSERKYEGNMGSGIERMINVDVLAAPANEEIIKEKAVVTEPEVMEATMPILDADPKRITVNNYGTVQNQKFISIETMNGDIHL